METKEPLIYQPVRSCPLCGKRSAYSLGRLNYALFDDLKISGKKVLVTCRECGMTYDDVYFTEQQLEIYYQTNEHYAASSLGGSGSSSEDNRQRYGRMLSELNLESKSTIIEVGCGQGGFVAECLRQGYRAAGIEPSIKSRAIGEGMGLKIYRYLAEFRNENPKEKVNAVVLSHVLEHLLNPLGMLEEIQRFAPEATIYLEVPDAQAYLGPNKVSWHELYFEHLNHFTREIFNHLAFRASIGVSTLKGSFFSEKLNKSRCLILTGKFNQASTKMMCRSDLSAIQTRQLPPLPGENLMSNGKPTALWGISQYAMLLMGSLRQLGKVDRLFDASPAKIGRKIRGVIVEDIKTTIKTLDKNTILIIPYSPYADQMYDELQGTGTFTGQIIRM
jgi:hypothetical protein